MTTKWTKLRAGHWVSPNGYEILRHPKRQKFSAYDQDGVRLCEHQRSSWDRLTDAQAVCSRVESEGEATLAARHVKL